MPLNSLMLGGAVAAVLGLVGLIGWHEAFFILLKGGLPIALLLGGILAVYVGFDDLQDKIREEKRRQEEKLDQAREEIEMVKARAELYREELEKLKEGNQK
ncbi:MAG TPA: hypothetical protein PKH03_02610 [Syntrophales bacterium]|nr:hypothetical protein [Syntrophales bacterium]